MPTTPPPPSQSLLLLSAASRATYNTYMGYASTAVSVYPCTCCSRPWCCCCKLPPPPPRYCLLAVASCACERATALTCAKQHESGKIGKPRSPSDPFPKQAQAAKAGAAARGGEPAPPPAPGGGPSPSDDTMPQVADSPFSPALQEELRVAITVLAARLQREKPMTRSEFERFESAVGVIVEVTWYMRVHKGKGK